MIQPKAKVVYETSELVREVSFEDLFSPWMEEYPARARITFVSGGLNDVEFLWSTPPDPNGKVHYLAKEKPQEFFNTAAFWSFAEMVCAVIKDMEEQIKHGDKVLRGDY